jgi:hypothetical protein
METKEELQKLIKELKRELDGYIEKLKNFDKWKPQKGETYYYVDSNVEQNSSYCYGDDQFLDIKFKNFNLFKTPEEAKKVARRIKIENQLECIAKRLNNGREIDWTDSHQPKYYLSIDNSKEKLFVDLEVTVKRQGIIYCLDASFLDVAKREMNMTELLEYMKG